MRVALISDTHLPSIYRDLDGLGPEAAQFLSTVDLILHGGDIVTRGVLDWCGQFAPVLAARGNHDVFDDPRLADTQMITLEGWRIGMVHDLRPVSATPAELAALHFGGEAVDIMIGGDTHVDRLDHSDGIVVINSGSPNLPHHKETRLGTVALLDLAPGRLRAEILVLGHTPGSPNPGTARYIEVAEGRLVSTYHSGASMPIDR